MGSTFLRQEDPFLGSCRNKYIPDFWISLFFITLSHFHTLWYGSCYVQEVHLFLHVWALSKTNSFRFLDMSGYWATCLFLTNNRLANNNFKETMIPLAQKSFMYICITTHKTKQCWSWFCCSTDSTFRSCPACYTQQGLFLVLLECLVPCRLTWWCLNSRTHNSLSL